MRNTTTDGNASYRSREVWNVCPYEGCLCVCPDTMCEMCLRIPNNTCCNNYYYTYTTGTFTEEKTGGRYHELVDFYIKGKITKEAFDNIVEYLKMNEGD